MHAQRFRRYGDVNYVTSDEKFRELVRAAQIKAKPAKPTSYLKHHGRHEHRVVAEKMIGRPLLKGEIVHHIDGNKHNNDPANLLVMMQADHMRLHHAEMVQARKDAGGYARKARHGV